MTMKNKISTYSNDYHKNNIANLTVWERKLNLFREHQIILKGIITKVSKTENYIDAN
jgi:hypothetical protein